MAGNLKHIEVDGCIVNIRTNLRDSEGRRVTSIEVLCDRVSGERWTLPDLDNAHSVNIRVVEEN